MIDWDPLQVDDSHGEGVRGRAKDGWRTAGDSDDRTSERDRSGLHIVGVHLNAGHLTRISRQHMEVYSQGERLSWNSGRSVGLRSELRNCSAPYTHTKHDGDGYERKIAGTKIRFR